MVVFKCDRCGKELPNGYEGYTTLQMCDPDTGEAKLIEKYICEQCYTTIKEVLQDGEIK